MKKKGLNDPREKKKKRFFLALVRFTN